MVGQGLGECLCQGNAPPSVEWGYGHLERAATQESKTGQPKGGRWRLRTQQTQGVVVTWAGETLGTGAEDLADQARGSEGSRGPWATQLPTNKGETQMSSLLQPVLLSWVRSDFGQRPDEKNLSLKE